MPSSPSKEDVGDAKHTATNILALLQRTDELKEEDLSAVLEKIKPAGVQVIDIFSTFLLNNNTHTRKHFRALEYNQ